MKSQSEKSLADDDTWTAILEPVLCQDKAAVELLARLLFTIRKAIDSGSEGAIQASKTLLNGIELIYLHTKAHKAALKLYVLSLEGNLKPEDEPLNLINEAIEREKVEHINRCTIAEICLTPELTRAERAAFNIRREKR